MNAKDRDRITRIKATNKEELRKRFKGMEYIRQLELVYKEYDVLLKELDCAKIKRRKPSSKEQKMILNLQLDILKQRTEILKSKIDLNFRRLKFVLPELRSIEITDSSDDGLLTPLAQLLKDALEKD